ncbi:MAG: LAGLIDADG family homing endonuclease [Candidatus Nomurabacteria bacterium]|nr:LAGLIDADG family homing endonuclease [Candidatus Nomurabacteria bacterium]
MGSRSKITKEIERAYIAGFLDGDGSLMLQLKKRSDSKRGIRFMATICFYQDTRHEETLYWIRKVLGIGYISRRNDGMTELRINGYIQIAKILKDLLPFVKFKKIQADALCKACDVLSKTKFQKLSKKQLAKLVDLILVIQSENYVTKKKKTKSELYKILDLTP